MTNDETRGTAPTADASGQRSGGPSTTDGCLGRLSNLAVHGFAGVTEAADEILRVVGALLGTRSSYIAHIHDAAGTSAIVAAHNEAGGCGVEPGVRQDLRDTF